MIHNVFNYIIYIIILLNIIIDNVIIHVDINTINFNCNNLSGIHDNCDRIIQKSNFLEVTNHLHANRDQRFEEEYEVKAYI